MVIDENAAAAAAATTPPSPPISPSLSPSPPLTPFSSSPPPPPLFASSSSFLHIICNLLCPTIVSSVSSSLNLLLILPPPTAPEMAAAGAPPSIRCPPLNSCLSADLSPSSFNLGVYRCSRWKAPSVSGSAVRKSGILPPIEAVEDRRTSHANHEPIADGAKGNGIHQISSVGKSTNILWHGCSVGRLDRQNLLQQRGCVLWITGLSGSGKSTVACALSRGLHSKGKLTYILDGDNVRHGLNSDLSFTADDRAENIRRIGEVAKLFADAGVICIASLISPYREDRDACRAKLPDGDFIEVFMDIPLEVCESRDPKGLYKLARAGKIKGFTGIDAPYEPPLNCEIVLQHKEGDCGSPGGMARVVISYLEENGYLQA